MSIACFPEERCVVCGEVIEEGRQVCPCCDQQIFPDRKQAAKPKKARSGKTESLLRRLLNRKRECR